MAFLRLKSPDAWPPFDPDGGPVKILWAPATPETYFGDEPEYLEWGGMELIYQAGKLLARRPAPRPANR